MLHALLLLTVMLAPQDTVPEPCASRKPGAAITAVVVTTRQPGDSVLNATVCVVPARSSSTKVGSYHGELHFDSTAVSVLQVRKLDGGIRVENSTIKGRVNFAGAAPSGFPGSALMTVSLKVRRSAAQPPLRLIMKELNATDGTSLLKQLVTVGVPK